MKTILTVKIFPNDDILPFRAAAVMAAAAVMMVVMHIQRHHIATQFVHRPEMEHQEGHDSTSGIGDYVVAVVGAAVGYHRLQNLKKEPDGNA